MKITLQSLIPPPTDGQNAWQYVAYIALLLMVAVGGFLFRENSKLRDTMLKNAVDNGAKWQTSAEICSADAAKTAAALKLSNDKTVALAGKVDTISSAQTKFMERLDKNGEQLVDLLARMDKCQNAMDRITDRFSRGTT
jgi:hypothetical protein